MAKKSESTTLIYNSLSEVYEIEGVILEQPVSRKKFLKRRVKKLGYFTVLGQILFQLLMVKFLKIISQNRINEIRGEAKVSEKSIPESKIIEVDSVNSEIARDHLKALKPDIIIVNGTRIISKKTIESTCAAMINTHVGITPLYRGVHGGYWALVNGDSENCGVTVHLIDTGIDTGGILGQAQIKFNKKDNFYTYPLLQVIVGTELLKEVILKDNFEVIPSRVKKSMLWSHPTIFEYLKNYIIKGVK